jgi:hypothetical protein
VRETVAGDLAAAVLIANRIEGRPGIRPGEADLQAQAAREGVQQAIEDIVTAFTEAKLAQPEQGNGTPSDAALDIAALDRPCTHKGADFGFGGLSGSRASRSKPLFTAPPRLKPS